MRQLASWTFREGGLHEQLIQFEEAVSSYELASSKVYPEDLVIATIVGGLREPLKSQVQLRLTSKTTYAEIREWILQYEAVNAPWSSTLSVRTGQRESQSGGPQPMEVDRVWAKGKEGKGKKGEKGDFKGKKGKGKGKDGKGKPSHNQWSQAFGQWKQQPDNQWNQQGGQWKQQPSNQWNQQRNQWKQQGGAGKGKGPHAAASLQEAPRKITRSKGSSNMNMEPQAQHPWKPRRGTNRDQAWMSPLAVVQERGQQKKFLLLKESGQGSCWIGLPRLLHQEVTGDIDPQELSEFPSWCGEVEEYGLEEFEGSGSDDEGPSWETGAEKPPELEGEELERVDRQADLKESVLRKPVEGKKVEEYAHLTTKIVVSLDIKDAYLQVPQPSLAIITVDARALGAEQEGQVTYVLEQLLPGQHVGARANVVQEQQRSGEVRDDSPCGSRALGFPKGEREQLLGQIGGKVTLQVSQPLVEIGDEIEFLKRRYILSEEGLVVFPSTRYTEALFEGIGKDAMERDTPADASFLEPDSSKDSQRK
eukprot:s1337_g14.t1